MVAASGDVADFIELERLIQEQVRSEEIAADHGGKTLGIEADVTNPDQVESMIASTRESLGHVDILVNSAGAARRTPHA